MAPISHLFLQAWLNPSEQWAGLQVICSTTTRSCQEFSARLCQDAQIQSLGHRLTWFVPAHPPAICPTEEWPLDRAVLVVKRPDDANDALTWRNWIMDLRSAGHKFALTCTPNTTLPPEDGPWDFIEMSVSQARTTPTPTLKALCASSTLILTGVRNRSDFDWGLSNYAALMSTEFLLVRGPSPSKPDLTRVKLLKLLTLIVQDADTREIEEIFRQEPKLSYSLLRLVNSAALSPRSPITSFSQAINLLGRKQLQRWLQLLVYADPNQGKLSNPLLLQAAARGRLLELLAPHLKPRPAIENLGDEAFMTGIFSLLDVLLNLGIPEILPQLPLPEPVQNALSRREGPFGALLSAIDAAEHGSLATAEKFLTEAGISCEEYLAAQLNAFDWASKIHSES